MNVSNYLDTVVSYFLLFNLPCIKKFLEFLVLSLFVQDTIKAESICTYNLILCVEYVAITKNYLISFCTHCTSLDDPSTINVHGISCP